MADRLEVPVVRTFQRHSVARWPQQLIAPANTDGYHVQEQAEEMRVCLRR